MFSAPRLFNRTSVHDKAACNKEDTLHFTCVKRVRARVYSHAHVKFKLSCAVYRAT